ncbi:acyl-CoA thioesterase [Yeosuana sp. AK3]
MQVLETIFKVKKSDLDDLNHVNNVRYVQWVQEIAKEHWQKRASINMLKNYYWVMINHCIEYKNPAFFKDTIQLKTYIKSCKGPISNRIVEISNSKNGLLLATSETKWCLLNTQTNKPIRITTEITDLF